MDHFKYRPSRQKGKYNDLHFGQLATEVSDISEVDLDRLRSIRVEGISAESEYPIYDWQLYKCLNHEITDAEHTYVLNNGKWYEVASDFASAVPKIRRTSYPLISKSSSSPRARARSNSATFTPSRRK